MNCKAWQDLNIFEQREFSGKILHLMQNSDSHFTKFAQMVRIAEKKGGLLEGITINPTTPDSPEQNNINNLDKNKL